MKKGTKVALVIFIIVVPLGGLIAWAWKIWQNITIGTPSLKQLDLESLLSGVLGNSTTPTTATIEIPITNNNSFSISASGLYIELSYQGSLVAKTSNVPSNEQKIVLTPNETTTLDYTLDIFINDQFKSAVSSVITGGSLQFDYYVRLNILGFIPIWYNGQFTYTK